MPGSRWRWTTQISPIVEQKHPTAGKKNPLIGGVDSHLLNALRRNYELLMWKLNFQYYVYLWSRCNIYLQICMWSSRWSSFVLTHFLPQYVSFVSNTLLNIKILHSSCSFPKMLSPTTNYIVCNMCSSCIPFSIILMFWAFVCLISNYITLEKTSNYCIAHSQFP